MPLLDPGRVRLTTRPPEPQMAGTELPGQDSFSGSSCGLQAAEPLPKLRLQQSPCSPTVQGSWLTGLRPRSLPRAWVHVPGNMDSPHVVSS